MTKIDPYKHKERYEKWKEKINEIGYVKGISKINSDLMLRYIFDMEIGLNISSANKKGSRSYPRLNNLKQRMKFILSKIEDVYGVKDVRNLQEEQAVKLFSRMRKGEITRLDGKTYKSTSDFVKVFKAFWHWYMKISKKEGKEISDITRDIDTSTDKPKWVYLEEKDVRLLIENAKYEYKVLMWFLYDTGIRSPTELLNVKVGDLFEDCKKLMIREEISKTFGRKINLLLCNKIIKEYVELKKLKPNDYLFSISPKRINEYLKRLAKRILGDSESLAGERYSNLTMYDFRHCACCYWLPKYKSESALKYRFGWKGSDKIHYYSELLGMKDTITEDDMLDDITKTEVEQRLAKTEKENELLKEQLRINDEKIEEICLWMNKIKNEIKIK